MRIIAGMYRNRPIHTPKGKTTRPTSSRLRESLFNICQYEIDGAHFLDLFAGSGAMGLEALSRGAQSATFIERDKGAMQCIQKNIESFHVQAQSQVLCGDVLQLLKLLQRQSKQFDIIYADPPYQTMTSQSILYSTAIIQMIDTSSLLKSKGRLFIEEAVEAAPVIESLSHLVLKSQRKMGPATLQEYEKV